MQNLSKARLLSLMTLLSLFLYSCQDQTGEELGPRKVNFNTDWVFGLADSTGNMPTTATAWRGVQLPHDWSIEGEFSEHHPATYNGGALPGGVGWYKKNFTLPAEDSTKKVFIHFDGVYMNSEVWINGKPLGRRPNGYIGFEYELTPQLNFGDSTSNELLVKVDNSQQPNSRWYSGSGIYRNVYLLKKGDVYVDNWGVFVQTTPINTDSTLVTVETTVTNSTNRPQEILLRQRIAEAAHSKGADTTLVLNAQESRSLKQSLVLPQTQRWSLEDPHLYHLQTSIIGGDGTKDQLTTTFGVRTIAFDLEKGFFLNDQPLKIKGVCNHHDLGPLGTAVNRSAIERQLDILAGMGVNAIRTSHNPPAPELLELCNEKGFLVMDEAFDEWKKSKVAHGYAQYWDEWHEQDLRDFIKRDRNHPSVIIWSVGNEILEQWDSTGIAITQSLTSMVRSMDDSRPITTGNNPPSPTNSLNAAGVLDLVGYNYAHQSYEKHLEVFPNTPFIATETTSALETRGYYDKNAEEIKRWPYRWDQLFTDGNPGNTVSAYDQVSTPWGSTHEETWKIIKKHPYLSGMFIWTGFDYLGEPTPYVWPSRSSYFGVIDLAGFPKDVYYMYQSEWTDQPVLHVFPHWTWTDREEVDIWVYYAQADEVELSLNGQSLGRKKKTGDELHISWRVPYEAGELKAISYLNGKQVLEQTIRTAAAPAKLQLDTDRTTLNANERELAFISVSVLDENGTLVPDAENKITFTVEGPARIKAVGNGDPTSHASFLANDRQAFHGKCLVIIEPLSEAGEVTITAQAEGLKANQVKLTINK